MHEPLLRVQDFHYMYIHCFFTDHIPKTLNMSFDQKIRPSVCFKTGGRILKPLTQVLQILGRVFETLIVCNYWFSCTSYFLSQRTIYEDIPAQFIS